MARVDDLKKRLAEIQEKGEEDQEIKRLEKKIKAEEFKKTTGGKIFNIIADVGDAGMKATSKLFSEKPKKKGGEKKKVPTMQEIMDKLPQ